MPEGIGYGSASAFIPRLGEPSAQRTAEQVRELNSRQDDAVAETVQRQADSSTRRAESLSRVADQLENRAESRTGPTDRSLGNRVDISV